MNPLRTLRGRLAGAMIAILFMAVITSLAANMWDAARRSPMLPSELDTEPYQDSLVLAAFAAAALLLIWLVSGWSLRPLARVSQQARTVGPQNAAIRLSSDGLPAEIVPLVDAVNGALDRMADAVAAERRFTENAAHELRTPLAVLSLRLQRARTSPAPLDWASIEQDVGNMNRLVAQLLDLARKENAGRTASARAPVNFARIAREAAATVLPLVEAKGRSLAIDVPDSLPVFGAADDLRDAVINLLENAVIHGRGQIGVRAAAAPGKISLVISDQGRGVAPDLRHAVFERFNKAAASQGSGLGLAIVREVARSHGGDVLFLASEICQIELTLPAQAH